MSIYDILAVQINRPAKIKGVAVFIYDFYFKISPPKDVPAGICVDVVDFVAPVEVTVLFSAFEESL